MSSFIRKGGAPVAGKTLTICKHIVPISRKSIYVFPCDEIVRIGHPPRPRWADSHLLWPGRYGSLVGRRPSPRLSHPDSRRWMVATSHSIAPLFSRGRRCLLPKNTARHCLFSVLLFSVISSQIDGLSCGSCWEGAREESKWRWRCWRGCGTIENSLAVWSIPQTIFSRQYKQ